jgi:hypothetical protein
MRSLAIVAALALNVASIACLPVRAEPNSEDRMRNARMNACIKILQQNDKALKDNWRGHCGTEELDQELAGSPADPQQGELRKMFPDRGSIVVDGDISCRNTATPVATTSKCGLGTPTLYPSLQAGAAMRIKLPGNKCGAFIPVLFTNKTDYACNAVQSRIACVDVLHDDKTDRTSIKFSTRRGKNAETTTIEFGAPELAQHDGRISDLISHPQFTIIPELTKGEPVTKKILDATRIQEKDCIDHRRHSPGECARRSGFQADANMQEAIRRYRNPRHDSPQAAITSDGSGIVEFLKSKHIDQIQEQWILFLSIAANEVGLEIKSGEVSAYDPIYGVSDAVDGNSGLSFGAHQIDLGANEDPELKLFWDVVDAYKAQHPDAVLEKAEVAQVCIDLPLRLMTVGALALTYQAAPRMTVALRSSEGFEAYNQRLLGYLAEEVGITASKPGLFKRSMITRVLFSDLKNQIGSGSRIETLANQVVADGIDLSSCQEIVTAEDTMLARLIWKAPSDHSQGKTQYSDRYQNIQRIVRNRAPHEGVSGCL